MTTASEYRERVRWTFGLALLAAAAAACHRAGGPAVIAASGHVEATEVRVGSEVAGKVESLPIEEGTAVAAGQEIARIDRTDIELARDAARAERAQAEAELRLRRAGSRAEDVAEGQAQVERAQADLEGAQHDLDRMLGLLASGSGTEKARDDAKSRRDQAAAGLRAAHARLARLRAGSRPQEVDAARARMAAADARLAELQEQWKDAAVLAPVAGAVTEKLVERGELVTRGTALAVITDLAHPWLTVYLAEPDLGRIRLGQEAEVTTDSGQQRKGRVTFVSPQAEFTPKNVQTPEERSKLVYRVKIALENADGVFKTGMPAQARLRPLSGSAP